MSSSSVALYATLFAVICLVSQADCRPEKHVKECKDDKDCADGFTCMQNKHFDKPICAKQKDMAASSVGGFRQPTEEEEDPVEESESELKIISIKSG